MDAGRWGTWKEDKTGHGVSELLKNRKAMFLTLDHPYTTKAGYSKK